ncbi:hypothetical protein [Pseudoclavibacter sp. RFBG4]|nr:hypothetical protein [Pseudoclavibacter sp. RFBG4]
MRALYGAPLTPDQRLPPPATAIAVAIASAVATAPPPSPPRHPE